MTAARPLEGIRVCDFGWVWSGPQVATWLAEFGADVIKIEHGKRLDNTRLRGRPVINGKEPEGPSIELSPYFHQVNHGKRSITLDLKKDRGRELVRQLVAKSDIVIENLSPGAMARLGLDYDNLKRICPGLIYLSMSAFGQTGPLVGLKAYAPIMSSHAGMESMIGYPDEPPIGMMNYGMGDPNAAIHALLPVLAALHARRHTGAGCYIDLSQIEAMISAMPIAPMIAMASGEGARPAGNRHPAMVPHGIFPAAGDDAWISVAAPSDESWARLAPLIGLDRPEWATLAGRLTALDAIETGVAAWTAGRPAGEICETLRSIGIACSPVVSPAELSRREATTTQAITQEVVHPHVGAERLYPAPWRMSATPPHIGSSAPLLGADNDAIFTELFGFSPDEIERLKDEGVIA